MAGNSHERGQSVVGRLLRILEAFSPERPELTTAEISRRAGLPPSTVYRLLAELIERGVIERVADGRYSVGLRLWEIGKLAPRAERLTEVASPYLHDLYEVTRGSLHLAVRAGGEALYRRRRLRPPLRGTGRPGGHAGAVDLDKRRSGPARVLAVAGARTGPRERTPRPRPTARRRRERTASAACWPGSGAAGSPSLAMGTTLVVAAPVFGPPGELVAALALSAPDGDSSSMVPMVWMTTQRISRELLPADAAPPIDDGLGRAAGLARVDTVQHGRAARAAPDRGGLVRVRFLSQ